MRKFLIPLLSFLLIFISCKEDTLPKPKGFLKLDYHTPQYELIENSCNYQFEKSEFASLRYKNNCWMELNYPEQKATIHITYRAVNKNLNEILKEVEKLTFEHAVKAETINSQSYENFERKVYGKMYFVEGNAASNIQFHLTDSAKHVVAGALYFYSKPNYDSIVPAVKYLEKDIKHLMETFNWK